MNLAELTKKLQSEETAWAIVEAWRWPNGPVCPHCGVINHAYYLTPKKPRTTSTGKVSYRRLWKCGDCGKQFSALVGTVMEDSKIPLSKWILAFYMVISGKNAVSAHELHRDLGITYKSAWFVEHRIRHALAETSYHTLLAGTVEADETYVGGKRRHIPGVSHTDLKVPVVTLVERGGEVRSSVIPTVTSKNVKEHLQAHVSPTADLMTDQAQVYTPAGRSFASHETVDHARDEWVRGRVHVNTAEGYFSQFKRSLDGTYHHVSPRHLRRYVAEFDFRYNTRKEKDGDRLVLAVRRVGGKRLMYRDTAGKKPT